MREIPEPLDLEKISKACDHILSYMRAYHTNEETLEAMATICQFITRIKRNVEWFENVVHILRMQK